jgi:hypothetical protein
MIPENNCIEKLIDRFFDGQTTNEEEQTLYAFFSGDTAPPHLQKFKPLFAYFETGIKDEFNSPAKQKAPFLPKRKRLFWASIAASLLIAIASGVFYLSGDRETDPYEGSYIIRNGVKITDPEIVRPEIEETLFTVWLQQTEYELAVMENALNAYQYGDEWETMYIEL